MEKILEAGRKGVIPLLLIGVGVGLVGGGLIIAGRQKNNDSQGIVIETNSGISNNKTIVVDVSGAVEKPGVYKLPNDSRRQDALITAGGLGAKADRNYVAKYINLAQIVSDGEKIFIPEVGGIDDQSNPQAESFISLNSATLAELDSLPGIGSVTANKIVAGRPYQNIAQLVDKRIVSKAVFENIKDRLSVY